MTDGQKIVIKAIAEGGETAVYLKMASPTMAEMVFYGLTHDLRNKDLDWELRADGELINWHYPKRR
jgi:hypothetical protein